MTAGGVPFLQNVAENGKGNENLGRQTNYCSLSCLSLILDSSPTIDLSQLCQRNRWNVNPLFTACRPSHTSVLLLQRVTARLPPPVPTAPVLQRDTSRCPHPVCPSLLGALVRREGRVFPRTHRGERLSLRHPLKAHQPPTVGPTGACCGRETLISSVISSLMRADWSDTLDIFQP